MAEFEEAMKQLSGIANKVMIVAAALIAIAAVAGVIYATAKGLGQGRDNGFIMTSMGNPITWNVDDFPIVALFGPLFPERYKTVYRSVATEINGIVGRQVLDIFGDEWHGPPIQSVMDVPRGHIYLALSNSNVTNVGGINEHRYNPESGELLACIVRLSPEMPNKLLVTAMRHEVGGHGLGLAHDSVKTSVMNPIAGDRVAEFTDRDKRLLRSTYGKK